jgi:small conductance mechanosensitive channel
MEALMEKMYEYVALYGMNIVAALLIFIVGKWLAKIATNVLGTLLEKAKVEQTLVSFIRNLIYVGFIIFVIIAALSKLGVETTSFVAVLGAAGLAVGLALQGSLANFAAGVLLIMFKPFKVGDFAQVAGETGTIKEINIFNTVLHTMDNLRKIVPNSKVTGDTITNYTDVDMRRVDLTFGISYSDNIKTAKDALERVVAADARVLKSPAPTIAVAELGESSVNLVCRPWCKPSDYWSVYFDITEKGKLELEKSGITIPFPQRDVHLFQAK